MDIPPPHWLNFALILALVPLTAVLPFLFLRWKGRARSGREAGLAVLILAPLLLPFAWTISDNAFSVEGDRLYARAAFFQEMYRSLDDFDLDAARAGPRSALPEAALGVRRNGIGLPRFQAGRFSLRRGGQAFVILSDNERVLYLPARVGLSLVVSLEDPQQVLEQLRASQAARGPASEAATAPD